MLFIAIIFIITYLIWFWFSLIFKIIICIIGSIYLIQLDSF